MCLCVCIQHMICPWSNLRWSLPFDERAKCGRCVPILFSNCGSILENTTVPYSAWKWRSSTSIPSLKDNKDSLAPIDTHCFLTPLVHLYYDLSLLMPRFWHGTKLSDKWQVNGGQVEIHAGTSNPHTERKTALLLSITTTHRGLIGANRSTLTMVHHDGLSRAFVTIVKSVSISPERTKYGTRLSSPIIRGGVCSDACTGLTRRTVLVWRS